MNLRRKREQLKVQILDTERLIAQVADHPIMAYAFSQRLDELKNKLNELPADEREPVVALFFSGGPVQGSLGIDATFVGKAILPFQKMVHADLVQRGYGKVGERGQIKNADDAKLFLTALPRGSFGIELSKLDNNNLFDGAQIADSLSHVVRLIDASAKSDEDFAASLTDISQRTLTGLRQFLKVVADDKAGLIIESGGIRSALNVEDVAAASTRVADTVTRQTDVEMPGTLKGVLLESWRFDFVDKDGNTITGSISNELSEEDVAGLLRAYFNTECVAVFQKTSVSLKSGRIRDSFTLKSLKAK